MVKRAARSAMRAETATGINKMRAPAMPPVMASPAMPAMAPPLTSMKMAWSETALLSMLEAAMAVSVTESKMSLRPPPRMLERSTKTAQMMYERLMMMATAARRGRIFLTP